jgi:hypothetical protein
MRKTNIAILLTLTMGLLVVSAALAQSDTLHLSLSRDWGYGGFGNDIQGLFSMKITGPANLIRVEFYINDTRIGEVTAAPFRIQFNTDDYALGQHTLYAIGYTSDGQELRSNDIPANFVPPQSVGKLITPVLVVVVLAILGSALIPMLLSRGRLQTIQPGAERTYGVGGGGICTKCRRPFTLPLFGMNLGFSKLARCPYCGKWGVVRVQTLVKLREAEKAELEWGKAEAPDASEEDRLRKEMDDSKYQGT